MAELLQANWILLLIALAIGLLVAWWVFAANRTTRVQKEDSGEADALARRNQALIDAPPAAAIPPVVPSPAATANGVDDLALIKGLGPKLKVQLADMGVTTFAQIAAWDDAEIDRIDAQMGRFQGRIRRDDWVAQARLLAAGDSAGFARQFGNG
ncbi:MAG TPA: hypothetical protein VLA45_11665 [Paracoccaceae bacterium]|nr:hypothetical protein [Paracoccaceae bacterium]